MSHRHHHPGRYTWRRVLARLCLDRQAEAIIADQVDGCADCWQAIAEEFAGVVAGDVISACGVPELHPGGLVEGAAVRWVTGLIANALRVAELDARDVDDAA